MAVGSIDAVLSLWHYEQEDSSPMHHKLSNQLSRILDTSSRLHDPLSETSTWSSCYSKCTVWTLGERTSCRVSYTKVGLMSIILVFKFHAHAQNTKNCVERLPRETAEQHYSQMIKLKLRLSVIWPRKSIGERGGELETKSLKFERKRENFL